MHSTRTYHLACGDVLQGCPATFTGDRDEVLKQVSRHVRAAHGIDHVTPAVLESVLGNLRAG